MKGALPHRRQVILFLVAVILPSAALAVLGIRLISQEREIQRSRLADDRRAATARIRDVATTALSDIERQTLRSLDAIVAAVSREYSDPAVRIVARIADGRMVAPWEESTDLIAARRALSEPGFAERIRSGQRAELGRADPQGAQREYRAALASAGSPSQRGMAALLTARATASAGGREAAEPLYVELLKTPDSVVDEHGVPYALYAAARLREWRVSTDRVVQRLKTAVEQVGWRSPTAFYLLRDLWIATGGAPAALEDEQVLLEAAQALRDAYERIIDARSPSNGSRSSDPVWIGAGPTDLLARAIGPEGEAPAAIVAVSAAAIADRLRGNEPARDSRIGALRIGLADGTGASSGATPLGIARPDLTVTFAEPPDAFLGRTAGLPNAFLVAALVLVLSITLFGGYLLLNDVKREMRVAEMRSDFVSSVSHELKTPLTAIRMFAETLRYGSNRDPAVTSEYLDTIVGESERLTRLLNNVLDLSKIEQGQKVYTREPTSLAQITERAARAVEYPLSTEGFRLNVDLDDAVPDIHVDSDSVEQAVLNLLTNAMKYSGAARDIDLSLTRKNGHAVIAVRDRGIGIPSEDQPRLTEKFYRVRSPENTSVPGTGLGLTLVEHTARAHGGFLTVESVPGEGSTFSIHFPMEVDP